MMKWARAGVGRMLGSVDRLRASELSGVSRLLGAEQERPGDAPTAVSAPSDPADDGDGATTISPPPTFGEMPASTAVQASAAAHLSDAAVPNPSSTTAHAHPSEPGRPATLSAAAAAAAQADAPVDLDAIWPAQPPKRTRELPRRAIAVAVGLSVIIILTLLCTHAAHQPAAALSASDENDVSSALVVSERDLKHRIQVTADYFHSRRPLGSPLAPGASAPAAPSGDVPSPPSDGDVTLDRKRRDDDPEDLVSHRGGRPVTDAKHTIATAADDHRRPFLYYPSAPPSSNSPKPSATPAGGTRAPAGTSVVAVLVTPVNLPANGGNARVIAKVDRDGALPRGSRLLGTASSEEGGRLSLRFTRLLLPDEREAKVDAEAQDGDGAFGVDAIVNAHHAARARGIASDVAGGAAADTGDALLSTFTGGIAGGVLSNAAHRAGAHRTSSSDSTATARLQLSAGTQFNVFFHEAAVERH
jgi:hypothetical protein